MLKFCIISAIICYVIAIISVKSMEREIKREGYAWEKKKYSIWEQLRGLIFVLIPFLNIILVLFTLLGYKTIKESVVKDLKKSEVRV